jgi:hypothetical protein
MPEQLHGVNVNLKEPTLVTPKLVLEVPNEDIAALQKLTIRRHVREGRIEAVLEFQGQSFGAGFALKPRDKEAVQVFHLALANGLQIVAL